MVWMGDNLYFQAADELDPQSMASRYRRQRSFAPLQALLTATSHVATWDDHDYGPNDANASYTMKGESLALFRRYWANPSYGLPDVDGRVRPGALRRRRHLPARRSLVSQRERRARRPGQDDVRRRAARVAARRAAVFARAGEARRQRQPDVEPREPLRGLEPLRARAAGVPRVAARAAHRGRCCSCPAIATSPSS